MTDLADRRCVPCEGDVKPLTRAAAEEVLLRLHEDWHLTADGTVLLREFRCKGFFRAMSFANAVAHVANLEDHHPDMEVGYGYCRVRYTTHAIGGLSENDFICAAKVDAIPLS
jgi:4a-hydroxytetrahydrobiopterin dehydratase